MVESLSRFLVALLLSLTVEFLMFALPAALGRRLLSSVLFEAPVEHPLLHELIAGFIVLYIVACGVSMSLLAYDQVVRWRDARHGRVLRFCVISAEAVLTSLKVTLVLVIELAVFPFALGYATEMALLPVTDETWAERAALHAAWPIMSLLSRWVVGIAYMYSFAASITNVRRVLRPGVLWFIRNPDDPRFDPVSEIVSRSVARHTRRLFASFLVYLVVLLSLTALPVALLRLANQMPLQTLTASGDPFMFSSSDLVMFNLLVPPMVRLYRFAPLASRALQAALRTFARALGLETYFFGFAQGEAVPNDPELVMYLNGEAEADEARGPFFERQAPYLRASWFALRALVVVALMWLTVVALVVLVVWAPLATGRLLRQRTLRTLAVSSDIHAFFVGALVLGFAIVFVGNVVHAAGVAWRHYVAMRDGDAPPAANDGAPAVPPAAPVEAAALQRAPRDPAQIRANVWRFWRSMTKMAVVALVAGLVKPVLVGSVFRLTFIDSSPAWSFSLSIVDDWLFGAVIEALRYAHAMVSRGDNVWRLPGEAAAALPAPLLQRFDVYDMSLLLRETAEVAMYSLTLRSVRVVVSFALGTFGMSVLHRRYISHFILLLAPVWNGLGNVIGSTGRYLEELHQSIRDERYRIGVKLRNNNE